MRFFALLLFLIPTLANAKILKEPSDPDGKGQFAQCMKKEDYATCRDISFRKMQELSEALSFVHTHNKALKSAGSSKHKPLKIDELSEKFDKWYTRYVALSTSPFYKGKL